MSKRKDYTVGRDKPPQHTRYPKGKSGNLKGRPKGSLNLETIMDNVLNVLVTITEKGGRKRKVSLLEGLITQLANKAASDPRALKQILQLYLMIKKKDLVEGVKEPLPWSDDDGDVIVKPEI
jgi:hypothetical protein